MNFLSGNDPTNDLLDKTPFKHWSTAYGDSIPFIFGYVVISSFQGAMFSLGLIDRQTEKFIPLRESPINLSIEVHRPQLMMDVLIIVPFLILFEKTINYNIRNSKLIGTSQIVHTSTHYCKKIMKKVTINKSLVFEKKWIFTKLEDAEELCNRLIEVFKQMSTKPDLLFRFYNNFSPIKFDPDDKSIVKGFFQPYGESLLITTLSEAIKLLLDISKSVKLLIELGIIHHDISFENIMKYKDNYFLVDFDEAIAINSICPALDYRRLSPESHCPDTFSEHGHEVDIWSIGRLMTTLRIADDRNQLLSLGGRIQRDYKTIEISQLICDIQMLNS